MMPVVLAMMSIVLSEMSIMRHTMSFMSVIMLIMQHNMPFQWKKESIMWGIFTKTDGWLPNFTQVKK